MISAISTGFYAPQSFGSFQRQQDQDNRPTQPVSYTQQQKMASAQVSISLAGFDLYMAESLGDPALKQKAQEDMERSQEELLRLKKAQELQRAYA